MITKSFIEWAGERVSAECMYLSHHAQMERGKDQVSVDDIIAVISNGEEVESYPDDPIYQKEIKENEDVLFLWKGSLGGKAGYR